MPVDLDFSPQSSQLMEVPDFVTIMLERLNIVYKQVGLRIKYNQEKYKEQYDKKTKPHSFRVGDRVRIFAPEPKKGLTPKLARPYKGPYEVVRVTPTNLFIIKNKNADPIVVHVNRCKRAENEPFKKYNLRSQTQPEIAVIEKELPTLKSRNSESTDYEDIITTDPDIPRSKSISIEQSNLTEKDMVVQSRELTQNATISLLIEDIGFYFAQGNFYDRQFFRQAKIKYPFLFARKNSTNQTPLQVTINRHKFHKTTELLTKNLCEYPRIINSQDINGITALMDAISNKAPFHTVIAPLIIYSDLMIQDRKGVKR